MSGNQTVTLTATALNSVLLQWNPSSSPGITNYRVYRGPANGGPYSVLATLGLVTAYTDYNVQNGENYYYVTTALNSSGVESGPSDQALAAVPAGVLQTATLSLLAPVLSSLTCSTSSLLSLGVTTCTVTLRSPAPTGGTTVSIASNSILLPVPVSSVTVPVGSSSGTFTATAGEITSNQTATLTAILNGASQIATLNLVAPAMLKSLTCSPGSLTSGSSTTCIITLSNAAPTATTVALSSNSQLLPVPATSVTVPAGSESAEFTAKAGTITSNQTATLKATLNGVSQTASINLLPAAGVGIASLSCSQPSLESYSLTFCTVKLTAPVNTAGGITVSLSTNTSLLWVPSVATIPEGVDIAVFPVFSGTVTQSQTAKITASANSSSASVSLTLAP
jgi:hypothetical protein